MQVRTRASYTPSSLTTPTHVNTASVMSVMPGPPLNMYNTLSVLRMVTAHVWCRLPGLPVPNSSVSGSH